MVQAKPVRVIRLPGAIGPVQLDEALEARGVRLCLERRPEGMRILVIITATLTAAEIEWGARTLLAVLEEIACRSL